MKIKKKLKTEDKKLYAKEYYIKNIEVKRKYCRNYYQSNKEMIKNNTKKNKSKLPNEFTKIYVNTHIIFN